MKAKYFQLISSILMLALTGCITPLPGAGFIILPSQRDPQLSAPVQARAVPTVNSAAPIREQSPKLQESYWPTNGWLTSTPEQQGVDSSRLGKLVTMLDKSWRDYDSVLVIRHGYVILELYRNGADAETQVNLNQATQSVLSILFGIAMNEQKVALNDRMLDYFAGMVITTDVKLKQRITLENLLAHTTGMDLRRWDVLSGPHEESDNWVQYALNIPLVSTPKQACDMSSATSHILGGVLQQATGDLLDYSKSRLFSPLGIVDVGWDEAPPGIPRGDGGLMLTPRDMAKLGYLYLRDGRWDGQQIVAADWVKKSTCQVIDDQDIDLDVNNVMCYDWFYANQDSGIWATQHPRFVAWGSQGQSIIGIPDKDIVLVTTGHTDIDDILMFVMADSFLVSAAMSDTPLPPNPAAYAQLQEKVKKGK